MPSTLTLESIAQDSVNQIITASAGVIMVGRDSGNTVCVDSRAISRQHGAFFCAGTQWFFIDFRSTNGSFLNGKALRPGEMRLVRNGDRVKLADFLVGVVEGDEEGAPIKGTFQGETTLIVFEGDSFIDEVSMDATNAAFHVGGPANDLKAGGIPNPDKQFEFLRQGASLEVIVHNKESGITINGQVENERRRLSDRDIISFGSIQIVVSDPIYPVMRSKRSDTTPEAEEAPARSPRIESNPRLQSLNEQSATGDIDLGMHMAQRTVAPVNRRQTTQMGLRFTQRVKDEVKKKDKQASGEYIMLAFGGLVFIAALIIIIVAFLR